MSAAAQQQPAAPAEPLRDLIEGRLDYLTWDRPWLIWNGGTSIDLRRPFWLAARLWRNKPCWHSYDRQHYQFGPAADSRYSLKFDRIGDGILLRKRDGFGFVNVATYFEHAMMRSNGRRVIVDVSEQSFLFRPDPSDEVFGVEYFHDGNTARIPAGAEHAICKIGTESACLFAAAEPRGFVCMKFDGPTTRDLLARKAAGDIRATRIGSCAVTGREGEGK
ncbi:hypothetical protein KQX64_06910 [Rhodopseudomonas palustris]|nr:hypothetical protein KQX64_06910 [Rhodopseudomonas palustris]